MDLVFKVKIQRYSWYLSFSPRDGEAILKKDLLQIGEKLYEFQSPQWGDNSKARMKTHGIYAWGFSPRNGEIILNNINKRIHCDNLYVSVP